MRYVASVHKTNSEEGAALIVTLLFLTVLAVLATGLLFLTQGEMKSSAAYKRSQQAFYVANGGVQKAVQWFNNSYSPYTPSTAYTLTTLPVSMSGQSVLLAGQSGSSSVYPSSAVSAAFSGQFSNQTLTADTNNSGVYSVNASLLRYIPVTFIDPSTFVSSPSGMERWSINAIGYWGTAANPLGITQVTAIIANSGNAMFDRALWGIDGVSLVGTVNIDSYDPVLGPYGGTNVGDLGSVGTNANVSTNGSVAVHGDVLYGPGGSLSSVGGCLITGQVSEATQPHYFTPVPSFTVGTTNVNLNGTATQTISAGSYGTIDVNAQAVLTLGAGTYYVDQLTTGAQGALVVTGPTTIFVKTAFSLGGGSIMNTTTDPANLSIFYSGTSPVDLNGGAGFYGSVYAPNAQVTLRGNTDFYGAYVGRLVNDSGTPSVHFDEGSLRRNLLQRPFRVVNWSQDSF